ncbi:MAG: FtsX-like permease family protein [Candidatus Hydrogenedentes bacterium]|nr:FtsX-like permease family protein [Candidatus Hydrogenedentota bacterium]
MILPRLIFREIQHRFGQAFLVIMAVLAAVGLYVAFHTAGLAADRETTRVMRDLGFNLRIIPAATDEMVFWAQGYATETIPGDYVQRFANKPGISYRHLTATLQQRINIQGMDVLLTGVAPEVSPVPDEKKPMIYQIAPGTCFVGHHVAERLALKKGDTLTVHGKALTIEHCIAEKGSEEDTRVYAFLTEVQEMLEMPGRINEIQALECLCRDPNLDSLDVLRAELTEIMPEAKVIMMRDMAKSRERQRLMGEKYFAYIMSGVLAVCALWLAILALLNVRERRNEIGVLRALGYHALSIAALFVGKAMVLGIIGAVIGFAAGTALTLAAAPSLFQITAQSIAPEYALLRQALWAAPLFSAVCALIPAALAATQDPAQTLREE